MVAGIVAQSMSLVSDSSQGVVDVMTYAVSIYAQAYIDHSSDYRASDRIGVYSAFFGASTLLLTCFFLTLFACASPAPLPRPRPPSPVPVPRPGLNADALHLRTIVANDPAGILVGCRANKGSSAPVGGAERVCVVANQAAV